VRLQTAKDKIAKWEKIVMVQNVLEVVIVLVHTAPKGVLALGQSAHVVDNVEETSVSTVAAARALDAWWGEAALESAVLREVSALALRAIKVGPARRRS
jgi:hypothetical protein